MTGSDPVTKRDLNNAVAHLLGAFAACAFLLAATVVALSIGAFVSSGNFPLDLFLVGAALFGCGALLGRSGRYQESVRR